MENIKKYVNQKVLALLSVLLLHTNVAFAEGTGIEGVPIFGGAYALLKDALGWLIILIPVACALMLGYYSLMKSLSGGDPTVVAHNNKAMKNVLYALVIGMSVTGIINFLMTYFK